MSDLLLDTCAAIWLVDGTAYDDPGADALSRATDEGATSLVSPITAWEVGRLVARGRLPAPVNPTRWFEALVSIPRIAMAPLTPSILIASSFLPGTPPRDPADRIIIATARENGLTILTRDRLILDYARKGHVRAIAC